MLRFRESFRGYNRDDVNAYIEQLNSNFSKKEAELRAIISDMQVSRDSAVNEANTELQNKLNDTTDALNSAKAEINRLSEELSALKAKYEVEASEKSRLYDSMTSQVGGIIIQANANADKIVAEARAEAETIRQNSLAESRKIMTEAEEIRSQAKIYADNCVRMAKESCVNEFDSIVSDASNELSTVCERIKSRTNSLLEGLKDKEKITVAKLNNN